MLAGSDRRTAEGALGVSRFGAESAACRVGATVGTVRAVRKKMAAFLRGILLRRLTDRA
jgi:hypothetical protein